MNGCPCSFILDTGADITAVLARFIPDCQYTGELFDVKVANDKHEQWKVAKVKIEIEGYSRMCKVCVLGIEAQEVLLGIDHSLTGSMHPKAQSEPSLAVGVVTRMQQKKRDDELVADVAAGKEDVVKVTTLIDTVCQKKRTRKNKFKSVETGSHEVVAPSTSLQEGKGIHHDSSDNSSCSGTSPSEDGAGVVTVDEVEACDAEDEVVASSVDWDEEEVAVGEEGGLSASNHPLPVLSRGMEGVEELIAQQQDDASLSEVRKKGEEKREGFSFNKEGVLTQSKTSDVGKLMVWVVIPRDRR